MIFTDQIKNQTFIILA